MQSSLINNTKIKISSLTVLVEWANCPTSFTQWLLPFQSLNLIDQVVLASRPPPMSKLLQRCVLLIGAIFVAFPLHPTEHGFALPTQSGTPPVAEADFSQMTQPGVLHEIVGDLGYEEYRPGNDYDYISHQKLIMIIISSKEFLPGDMTCVQEGILILITCKHL